MPDHVDKPVVPQSGLHGLVQGLFLDVPFALDSLWRRADFNAARIGLAGLKDGPPQFEPRPLAVTSLMAQLVFVILFFCYGPTLESLCTALGTAAVGVLRPLSGVLAMLAALGLWWTLVKESNVRVRWRRGEFLRLSDAEADALPVRVRFATAHIAMFVGSLLCALPLGFLGAYQLQKWTDPHACDATAYTGAAVAQIFTVILGWFGAAWILSRRGWSAQRQLNWLIALFAMLAVLLWLIILPLLATPAGTYHGSLGERISAATFAISKSTEASGAPYVHVFAIMVFAFLLLARFARVLAGWCMRGLTDTLLTVFRGKLKTVELLHDERPDPLLSPVRLTSAFVNGITYHPLHFALLTAFGALFSATDWLWATTTAFAIVAIFLIMWGSLSSRWEQLIQLIERWFLSGTPLIVSAAAIVIAVLRLMDVQYVSTVLDAAPFGTLFIILVMAFTSVWMMEYWINRWMGEQLLTVLAAPAPETGFLAYGPPLSQADRAVPIRGEVLALHGTGRFAVHGWYWKRGAANQPAQRDIAFTSYGFVELFEQLGKDADPDCVNNIKRRVRLYFNAVNIALVVMLGGFALLRHNWNAPLAQDRVVDASPRAAPEKPFDLASVLLERGREKRDVLIVAASGGGTRAALYTATALEGLARLKRSRDVVLLSGVSGGGVAVAYFANRFDQFQDGAQADTGRWREFRERMGEPFIQDVLEGASEWRIQSTTPLGTLLAESFERRLFTLPANTFGSLSGVGLILNTTVSGHPRQDSQMLNTRLEPVPPGECLERSRPYSALTGGRLVFTNLANRDWQPGAAQELADVRLDYTIIADGTVPLARASALNANFPPVFPNARVRLKPLAPGECGSSYFVTDGGATENLGLLSALYALRAALQQIGAGVPPNQPWPALPKIHLIAIEASAVTYDYSQDRGIGAATGGSKERIAGGLTQELVHELRVALPDDVRSNLHIHYLPLPLAFRSRGGFGTHWMSARTVRVSNPLITESRGRIEQWWRERFGQPHYEVLAEKDILALWSSLYDPDRPFCSLDTSRDGNDTDPATRVAHWICGEDKALGITGPHRAEADWQVEAWQSLVRELRAAP